MSEQNQTLDSFVERAKQFHSRTQFIDGHNDLPYAYHAKADGLLSGIDLGQSQPELHTDISRLREGGVGGQFWVAYAPAWLPEEMYVQRTIGDIDFIHNMVHRYPETFQLALTADEVESAFQSNKIASLIGVEGGHSISNSLGVLRMLYGLGVRYMTITHFSNTRWADSATDTPQHDGLTDFGREVVREMNRLGMLVDLSHVAAKTMHDVLEVSEAPVIFSHSSARGLTNHSRNVPDDVLSRVSENMGVVMVAFPNAFVNGDACSHWYKRDAERKRLQSGSGLSDRNLSSTDAFQSDLVDEEMASWEKNHPAPPGSLMDVADHIDYIKEKIGVDHIGIGSDFDGMSDTPVGLENVSKYPMLTAEMMRRGYADEEISKIFSLNILRVMRQTESVSGALKLKRGPSEARIEDLD